MLFIYRYKSFTSVLMAVILYIQLVAHLFKQNRYGTASTEANKSHEIINPLCH